MIREVQISLALIISLSIASLVVSGCASPGYQRLCDWCDDASQAQLKKDVVECNAMASNQFPDRSERRKTGRIVTSHGSTSCTTNKKGEMTCSTGSTYTYPEEETIDVTDHGARKKLFTECTDAKAKSYRPKLTSKTNEVSAGNVGQRNVTQEKSVIGQTFDIQKCKSLYQEWIFILLLEGACGFNHGIANRFGINSKSTCPSLTEDQKQIWAADPMIAFKKDAEEFGINNFCNRNKSAYEDRGK